MKINLGCGKDIKKGYVNIDERDLPGVDQVLTFVPGEEMPFEKGSLEEIYARDFIEHFPLDNTEWILKHWYELLQDGGTIVLGVPNIEHDIQTFINRECTDYRFSQLLYGRQNYSGNFHKQCFTKARLLNVLDDAGFKYIEIEEYAKGRGLYAKGIK